MEKLLKLGIDGWSIFLYFINTGLLLAALSYFLYKPLMKVIDERRKKIADSISEAQKLREEFEKTLKKAESDRAKGEAELKKELDNMHRHIETKRKELVTEMEAERSKILDKAHSEIDAKKEAIIKDAEKEVTALMSRIILDIVQNKVPENVIQESVADGWKSYRN
jgi:F-type H+-transporting ATPase subunit b